MNPGQPTSLLRIQLQTVIRSLGSDLSTQTLRLNEILEEFYLRMHDDLLIGFFFTGKDIKHIALQQGAFLLNAAGFADKFEGKGPSTAHLEMPPILSGHFDRRLVILRETLQSKGLATPIVELWVAFENTFRNIVVSEEVQHKVPRE